jgi:hypothetical protein
MRNKAVFRGVYLLLALAVAAHGDMMFTASYTDGVTGTVAQGESILIRASITNSPLSTSDLVGIMPQSLQFVLIPPIGSPVISEQFFGLCPVCGTALDIAPGETEIVDAYLYLFSGPGSLGLFPPEGTQFRLLDQTLIGTFADGSTSSATPPGVFTRTISGVPEPSSIALLATAVAGVAFSIRRRLKPPF